MTHPSFAALKADVLSRGLFEPRPWRYLPDGIAAFALTGAGFAALALPYPVWPGVIAVLLLTVGFGQLGLLAHDCGHRQVFRSIPRNDATFLVASLVIGHDLSWWLAKHNRHHSFPNDLSRDSDINLSILAVTEEQARAKRGIARGVVRRQATIYPLILSMYAIGLRLDALQYLFRRGGPTRYPRLERFLLVGHLVLYPLVVVALAGPARGVLVILGHQLLFGLYLGLAFAPNHKGLPMIADTAPLTFLDRQLRTSRNVRGTAWLDWLFGGLNYQIEHHLFPNLPRHRLREASTVVREYCRRHDLPYAEEGFLEAHRQVIEQLAEAARPLQRSPSAGRAPATPARGETGAASPGA